ncbi:hypothetical protein [Streptacidiphilus sp. MAP12-33]|uniref:hypothetical protein n=1 Tax=Streptacidiphilus sp. MAP12-33 TaxID=3156266 RepID=UPI003519CC7C
MSLLPITDEFFDEVSDGGASGAMGFWRMPGGFDQVIAQWSVSGAVAYVEAEYFGGIGEQRAAVWTDSAVVLGPLHVAEQQPFPAQGSPISQALRRIGVTSDGAVDEFAAVGLDRHRHMDDWLSG